MLLKLARQSLWNRRGTAIMTLFSLTISLVLLFGIDHLRKEARQSFTSTISGTDLIVGARSGQLNLLLYSVFRIGNATANVNWATYQRISKHPQISWTIPIALGDSHRGYRVLGTNTDYFVHYRYANEQKLQFSKGQQFNDVYETVLGAEVASKLGYKVGDEITLAHGVGAVSFSEHKDKPFTVTGILAATGTPLDQTVHVSLEGIEAIHIDWQQGAPVPGRRMSAEQAVQQDLTPKAITAFMVGLESRMATFVVQRQINEFKGEALSAILPGVALAELWQMLAMVENLLLLITLLVLIAGLVGMMTTLLASMKERQREMAVLRAVGAHPWYLFVLIQLEVLLLTAFALLAAAITLLVALWGLQDILASRYGLFININPFSLQSLYWAVAVLAVSALLACIPAFTAYKRALSDGLAIRL
ncbi:MULTISPECIES: ABC transporter permease [unclassified Arsukibacterium]|uniref:ABC transporter permease n=1 Tax=unclassified Arsukibacterium TaxID=2635278 RepID=UPI000C4A9304|nr:MULTISPECIES: ABC transporter permease [unclassified Arsukibacterium]MAA94194.1 peptide ABC transporter permease [Rheinheimera sp.]MBM34445.1 peptide ABC transporter permease [Rheinheimera sp.]HAW93959.1 peptide ABC transporter permease [Candidatus Azambacteria bacterium]|tara:strand:- start:61 stop:1317 length:1257 start_codon:yes stop_codon:yes gene_type:complete